MPLAARRNLLRMREGHEHGRVTYIELFFDLVFVFAVTQLSHGLLEHLSVLGALETALLLVAVWWVWIDTSWVTNWLDPEKTPVRCLLFGLMLSGLVLSSSIPTAFGPAGFVFAFAYACSQMGRSLFMLWSMQGHNPSNYRNFERIIIWQMLCSILWLAGGLADGEMRLLLWAVAVAIETVAPSVFFWVPGLGASTIEDWDVDGGHMAERCALFVIIALGESILVTGATFSKLAATPETVAAFVSAFLGSVAMLWIYFDTGAGRASQQIAGASDPGRLARLAYTYIHILLIAGIIVCAVSDELVMAHPAGHLELRAAAVIIGGPALYLIGNLLFKWATVGRAPLSHMIGLGLLALSTLAVPYASPLMLGMATTLVFVVVAAWETISLRR